MKFLFYTLTALTLILVPSGTYAAGTITITPQYPSEGEQVTVSAVPERGAPAQTYFVWSAGGKVIAEGQGVSTATITAPASGVETIVTALVGSGATAEQLRIAVRPGTVTLSWDAETTIPPSYSGRALPTSGGQILFVAIPELVSRGARVPASAITYTWRVNGKPLSKNSGVGRSTLRLQPPFYNQPFTVSVIVEAEGGRLAASQTVRVTPSKPEIIVYEERPLEGVLYNRAAVGTYPFIDNEVSFVAYPLYAADRAGLTPTWKLSGKPFTLTGDPWHAVFRKTGEGSGTYTIDVSVTHPSNFLADAAAQFLLQF